MTGITALGQCLTNANFQNQKNLPAPVYTVQHDMTARRDTSPSKPYLYIAGKERGFVVYNISSVTSPSLVASIPTSSLSGLDVNSMTQAGNYLYLALGDNFNKNSQNSGMAILDISNPAAPLIKSVYSYSLTSGSGAVFIDGNTAYLAAMQNGILVLDVTNKSSVQLISQFKPDINFPVANPNSSQQDKINARSMVVKNNIMYLCYDAGGVRILNVSNPASLKETGHYSNPLLISRARAYNNLVLNDTLVYVAADYCGMEVLNVKDTAHIAMTGWWNPWKCETTANTWLNSPGHANEIEYDPNCKMVFMSAGRSDLMAVSVANPAMPDSCSQFGVKADSACTWGISRYQNQVYLSYISTWPFYVPFHAEWGGTKIITYSNSCSLTGIQSFNVARTFRIYPNPVTETLNLVNPFMGASAWHVYDTDGHTIYEFELGSNESQGTIPVKNLPPGIYMLKGISGSQSFTKRFMVMD
ncbi:MAG: T9SS type A sorting domain-containing protein [Bacteroidetes bacterium]|nr:T9SS type A sorting domain-containing protein [Bacteroidota bacterium]